MTMKRRPSTLLGVVSGVLLVACGASAPPAAEPPPPDPASAPSEGTKSPPPDPEPEKRGPAPLPPPKVTGAAPPPPDEETRTMTPAQCDTLASILGGLVHKGELAKIDAKLSGDVRTKAENAAVESAKKVSESFHDTCLKSLVGKHMRKETLECMLKARDFATFDSCNK